MKLTDERLNIIGNTHFGLLLGRCTVDDAGHNDYIVEDINPQMALFIDRRSEELLHQSGKILFKGLHDNHPKLLDKLINVSKGGGDFDHDWYQVIGDRWIHFYFTRPLDGYFLAYSHEITKEISTLNACKTQLALEEKHKAGYEAIIKLMRRQYTSNVALMEDALQEAIMLTESNAGCIYCNADGNESFVLENCTEKQMRDFLARDYEDGTQLGINPHPLSLCIPIKEDGDIVATLCVANKSHVYDQFDTYQLTILMNNIWGVGKEIRAQEKLTYISYHDQLTGLYNRYYFEIELARLDNSRHLPISMIIGDVNGLKLTNDVFGHIEGDNVLKAVSNAIKKVCRDEDIIARWGGDEFILLLPQTPESGAKKLCQRINDAVTKVTNLVITPSISLGYSVKSDPKESLMGHLKIAEDLMYKIKLTESRDQRNLIIHSMQTSLYEKNHLTETNINAMSEYAIAIGKKMGLSHEGLDDLRLFTNLHDIGKVAIPDYLLSKPARLDLDEWQVMKKHPEIGYRIAQSTPELSKISDYILYHHEHYDGTGYPKGLKENDIPLASRIISVVDAYDAMTSSRPYSGPISKESAIRELRACGGSQFDPDVVEVFLGLVDG